MIRKSKLRCFGHLLRREDEDPIKRDQRVPAAGRRSRRRQTRENEIKKWTCDGDVKNSNNKGWNGENQRVHGTNHQLYRKQ